ncbi:MAG TPA: glycosyltransferase [Candidatus Tectomicrobia bacterium]|nr:glycosyltransferase [Candidatus Tectomicrobia bacterium]
MKPILMVAFHYPPEGGSSGVLRTLKFTKYLPRHGWTPHVLTLRESFYRSRDEQLVRDIPAEARVHRTFALDTSRHLAIRRRYPAWLTVPDRFVSWVPFGVVRGLRVIRAAGIRCLYSTCPQPSAHLIALLLKRRTGLPWVADFRDPWIEETGEGAPRSLRDRVDRRLERAVVRHADRIVATTPSLRDDFLRRYADLAHGKTHVIYNGYDEDDAAALPAPAAKREHFEILHAGLVTEAYRDPTPILRAVSSLIARGRVDRRRVRIVFLGGGKYPASAGFAAGVRGLALQDVVDVAGRVSHAEALERTRHADCLLLLQASDDTRALIPAKAFEYLRAGRPILALAGPGATADLLRDMEQATVVDPGRPADIEEAIAASYEAWRESPVPIVVERKIERFERANLTAELARILHDVAGLDGDRG